MYFIIYVIAIIRYMIFRIIRIKLGDNMPSINMPVSNKSEINLIIQTTPIIAMMYINT